MADKHLQKNIILLINQTLVIIFLIFEIGIGTRQGISALAQFLVITMLLSLAAYISLSNLNGNKILSSFSALLILVAWYFLFVIDESSFFAYLSGYMIPLVIFGLIKFLLCFLFQDGVYLYKKQIDTILLTFALLPVILKPFDESLFALTHLLQYIVSFLCCLTIIVMQRKCVWFFLRSEWKNLVPSICVFASVMAFYIMAFRNEPSYLKNSGMFLIICLPLWSVFKVAYHSNESIVAHMPLSTIQSKIVLLLTLSFLCGITVLFGLDSMFLLLTVQVVLWFLILYYLFTIWNITERTVKSESRHLPYAYALSQIEKEEELKKQFSTFLHDEVLQDLLSIKNLMSKSERTDVRELIGDTLEKLNRTVREEMQDYHSVMLKTLSLKENYINLLCELAQKFDIRHVDVIFECIDDLFLVVPYHIIIYRTIRELVTNAYKHSDCTKIHVILTQINEQIELTVKDNGKGCAKDLQEAMEQHKGKGLLSLQEQIVSLDGYFSVVDSDSQGVCIQISLPMKGEGSYQYFARR